MKTYKNNLKLLFAFSLALLALVACKEDDEQLDEATRLFRPVLNEDLYAEGNTIIVNMAKLKRAEQYQLEVSRDTFQTIEYTIQVDTNFVEINKDLIGEELFYSTLYQVRGQALSGNSEFNSRIADFGSVRTERFPTILNLPARTDVTDIAARLTWSVLGADVTEIRVFAENDLRLENALFAPRPVTSTEAETGEAIVTGLSPVTTYQIAIYSGDAEKTLRGWVNYTTREADVDPTRSDVIDIRDQTDPTAVENAVLAAPAGSIILIAHGSSYDLPSTPLNKSITIQAAYGFGDQKAVLSTGSGSSNWNLDSSVSNIDYIKFINVELRGADIGGHYVFNPSSGSINVGEVSFEKCKLTNFRGVMRIRANIIVDEFVISNSIVDSIGNYGIFTTDTNPGTPQTATVNNIRLLNSSFNYIELGIQSRNNSETIEIESCTFANFIKGSRFVFRYRGGSGNDNVTGGISIKNSIFGHSWDEGNTGVYGIQGINQGLENTSFDISNNFTTANFFFTSNPITGLPEGNYTGTQEDLWVDPANGDFNFSDRGFSGRFDTGDPRWRVQL
ncbi:DUF5123 domain-containing protein [Leeuwenhoekiella sp. H156]|uniref:DUF5123 domain-containing protein n=1 Tax=Leeuwenhoekiella sp. H156 TaxID=3450128 RepID=UPI003FA4306C